MDGVVEFYENYQANGFMEVGTPVRVLNFTNKELDRDLELNYFGARYYQPEFPRFLSPDPVGGSPEVPISWNRYLYCRNDPINYFDPDGRLRMKNMSRGDVIRIRPDNDNLSYVVQKVTIPTDNGQSIQATTTSRSWFGANNRIGKILNRDTNQVLDTDRSSSNPVTTNCHGLTFGEGKVWIQPDQVDTILAGDNYSQISNGEVQVGDVVIYRDSSGTPVHSVTVTAVDDSGNIETVSGINGTQTEAREQTLKSAWEVTNGTTIEFYSQSGG